MPVSPWNGGCPTLRCPTCGSPVDTAYAYCPSCGTKQGIPASGVAPAPSHEFPWLAPALAMMAGILLLVAVGTYYTGPPPAVAPPNLTVDLAGPSYVGAVATITVSYASPPASPQALLVSLSVNGTPGTAVPMPATSGTGTGPIVTPGGRPFRIDWTDGDRDGMLSAGDTFTITPLATPPPCCMYSTFAVLRAADGGFVASVYFVGPPAPAAIPLVSLGVPSRGTSTNVYISVNYVDPPTTAYYLRFQLVVGAVASPVVPFPYANGAMNASINGSEYIVAWYDVNYDTLLDAGDAFNITMINGFWPTAGTTMGFYLEWQDGTTLAHATWTA